MDSAAATQLFSILLQPVAYDEGTKLIIVPDSGLHLLPFDALLDQQGRFIVASHVVTYVPSATVLHLLRNTPPRDEAANDFLGVGDIGYSGPTVWRAGFKTRGTSANVSADVFDVTKLPALPGSKEEVMSVADAVKGRTQLLFRKDATEAAFKALPLSEFGIIHLAVHGVADTQFPDRAALVLASGSGEDGLLQAREIRGAKAVAASLWTVDDWYTTTLMKRMYEHLVNENKFSHVLNVLVQERPARRSLWFAGLQSARLRHTAQSLPAAAPSLQRWVPRRPAYRSRRARDSCGLLGI